MTNHSFRYFHSAAVAAMLGYLATAGQAQLTGSGDHLPLPTVGHPWYAGSPNAPTYAAASITNFSNPPTFTGTWSSPARSPWIGTFGATGVYPNSSAGAGINSFNDFTGLSYGSLPSGTLYLFGDLDRGSGPGEKFILTAWDTSGNQVTSAWLSVVVAVWGLGSGPNFEILPDDMPAWDFTNGVYTFDGSTTPFFTQLTFALTSLTDLSRFDLQKFTTNNGFAIGAPVPEPSSAGALCLGWLVVLKRRRKRRLSSS